VRRSFPSSARHLATVTGVGLVLVLLASCRLGSTSTNDAGPLEQTLSTATACHPKSGHSRFILGSEALTNTGSVPVTIDSISVAGADNLVEERAYVSPVRAAGAGPSTLMGIVNGPPPEFFVKTQTSLWKERREAAGAQVPPTRRGTDMSMVIVVHTPRANLESSVEHVVVVYHDDSRTYAWTGAVSYRLAPGRSCG